MLSWITYHEVWLLFVRRLSLWSLKRLEIQLDPLMDPVFLVHSLEHGVVELGFFFLDGNVVESPKDCPHRRTSGQGTRCRQ